MYFINTHFIQLTVKQVGTFVLPLAKLMQVNIAGAKLKRVSATETEVELWDKSQSYKVYETPIQISMLQDPTSTNYFFQDKAVTVSASATQTIAGATALTKYFNLITTCATSGDAVALPAASTGLICVIINTGAAAASVFPNNSQNDIIDGGVADAVDANLLAVGAIRVYRATDANNWVTVTY
jgi:hypothetical protein